MYYTYDGSNRLTGVRYGELGGTTPHTTYAYESGKNMLSILMQVFVIFALINVLWALYGYSLAFTAGNPFIGTFDKLFLKGVTPDTLAATFSKGVVLPELSFVSFQATFAAITVALIVGAFAERAKFSAILLFAVLWFTFSYLPIAHMRWNWSTESVPCRVTRCVPSCLPVISEALG